MQLFFDFTKIMVVHIMNNKIGYSNQFVLRERAIKIFETQQNQTNKIMIKSRTIKNLKLPCQHFSVPPKERRTKMRSRGITRLMEKNKNIITAHFSDVGVFQGNYGFMKPVSLGITQETVLATLW